MKTNIISIPVKEGNISHLNDPQGKGHNAFHAYVKVSDLPLNLPMGVNPRSQNLQSRVARQIQNGLVENDDIFHLLNRGLTITALNAKYNDKTEQLHLEMAGSLYGVLDGGHSYAVIRKAMEPYLVATESETNGTPDFMDAFVKIEVLEGVKSDLVTDLAQARNTSAQVRDESLANLEGSFDWVKGALEGSRFAGQIAYKENEDDDKFPIDIREIIAMMTLFHPKFEDSENPPLLAYASKGRSLQLFRDEPDGYMKLKPIIKDILELYDYIHMRFPDVYSKVGGFMGTGETDKRKSQSVKLAKVVGIKKIEGGFPLFYLGQTAEFRFPDGWLYPMVAAMRGVVSYKGNAKWKARPQAFFDKVATALVRSTLETSRDLGRNPNAVGKSRPHWMQLHEKVLNRYLSLLNTDSDKEVLV